MDHAVWHLWGLSLRHLADAQHNSGSPCPCWTIDLSLLAVGDELVQPHRFRRTWGRCVHRNLLVSSERGGRKPPSPMSLAPRAYTGEERPTFSGPASHDLVPRTWPQALPDETRLTGSPPSGVSRLPFLCKMGKGSHTAGNVRAVRVSPGWFLSSCTCKEQRSQPRPHHWLVDPTSSFTDVSQTITGHLDCQSS